MGLKVGSEDKVTGIGWYNSGVYNARDIPELVGEGRLPNELEENEPTYNRYASGDVFKVTITVEKI